MSRASKEAMDSLHVQIATVLKGEIEAFTTPVKVTDKDGKSRMVKNTTGLASMMNVARQFLKDNNVTAAATHESPIANLAASLPFIGDEFSEDDVPVH